MGQARQGMHGGKRESGTVTVGNPKEYPVTLVLEIRPETLLSNQISISSVSDAQQTLRLLPPFENQFQGAPDDLPLGQTEDGPSDGRGFRR